MEVPDKAPAGSKYMAGRLYLVAETLRYVALAVSLACVFAVSAAATAHARQCAADDGPSNW